MTVLRTITTILFVAFVLSVAPEAHAAQVVQKNPLFPFATFVAADASTTTPTIGAFITSFTITATGEDVFVPRSTLRSGVASTTSDNGIRYTLRDGSNNVVSRGLSISTLFTKAPIERGAYKVEKGTTAEFALLTLIDVPPTRAKNEHYSQRVEELTYSLRDIINARVHSTSGLADWKTPEVHIAP